METFEGYLHAGRLGGSSIKAYSAYHKAFVQWLEAENIDSGTFTYNELLGYIGYLRGQGDSVTNINRKLIAARHYGSYLIQQGQREDNPASGVFIKGAVSKVPVNLLEMTAMEQLCRDYNGYRRATLSRKVILGLLVYQGLRPKEIAALKTGDIRLSEGKVYIKGNTRSDGRLLQLNAMQVPLLQQHIQQHIQQNGGGNLIAPGHITYSQYCRLFSQLRRFNPGVINGKQLRSSVIAHWLRGNNLRQTQYMAGHKHISSTERYRTHYIEDLQKALRIHHPNA